MQTNASNCGPEIQNKYAIKMDAEGLLSGSEQNVWVEETEKTIAVYRGSTSSTPQQLRCNDKK